MTTEQGSSSQPAVASAIGRPGVCGRQVAVPLALLTGALILGIACSKRSGPHASGSSQAAAVKNPPAVAAPPVAEVPPTPAPGKKKVAKRRPATATYSDATYGVVFSYPRSYRMETGESTHPGETSAIPMNFVQPGGVVVAAVELPQNSYPGTDFASGIFQVGVNRALAAAPCEQFAPPDTDQHTGEPRASSQVKIGGRAFQEMDLPAGPAQPADMKYYHVFENGMCYEFALAMSRLDPSDGITRVDRSQVFSRLDRILSTVRLESLAKQPEVGETTAVGDKPAAGSQ